MVWSSVGGQVVKLGTCVSVVSSEQPRTLHPDPWGLGFRGFRTFSV